MIKEKRESLSELNQIIKNFEESNSYKDKVLLDDSLDKLYNNILRSKSYNSTVRTVESTSSELLLNAIKLYFSARKLSDLEDISNETVENALQVIKTFNVDLSEYYKNLVDFNEKVRVEIKNTLFIKSSIRGKKGVTDGYKKIPFVENGEVIERDIVKVVLDDGYSVLVEEDNLIIIDNLENKDLDTKVKKHFDLEELEK